MTCLHALFGLLLSQLNRIRGIRPWPGKGTMKRIIIGVAITAVLALLGYWSRGEKREVTQYNKQVVAAVANFDTYFTAVGAHMEAYSKKKAVDMTAFERDIDQLKQSIEIRMQNIGLVTVPASESCVELNKTLIAYGENCLHLAEAYRTKVLPYVKAHNPAVNDDDVTAAQGSLIDLITIDEQLLQRIQQQQQRMASAHGLKLH